MMTDGVTGKRRRGGPLPGALTASGEPARPRRAARAAAATLAEPPRRIAASATASRVPLARGQRPRPGSKLHVGCGVKRLAGWINADAVEGVGEVTLDLHDPEALPESTFSVIYACHVLEHCWPQDTPGILARMAAALLPGGTLRLSVPDLRLVVANCLDTHAYGDERSALAVLYGGSFSRATSAPDLHRQAFWRERLEGMLREAGLANVRRWGAGQYPEIDALKDYATAPAAADGSSLISLNLEADRPPASAASLTAALAAPLAAHAATPAAAGTARVVDVSVILGTVARPDMLRSCVESVRASLAESRLTHEVVVAYGDEDEPALPWMREQPDVVPVRAGLTGAIDAFNKAYASSRGRYICQLNDDVTVDGDSIARAVAYLEADRGAAGAVFKFDRGDGRGYRHETLSGLPHPNQMVARRETCEAVAERIGGFWGDRAHRTDRTYGGDTAFGAVCAHLGLRLDSVAGVTCRDLLAQDDLRAANASSVSPDHGRRWRAMYAQVLESKAPPPSQAEWPNLYVPRPGMPPRRSPVAAGPPTRLLLLSLQTPGEAQPAQRAALSAIGPTRDLSWWPPSDDRRRDILAAAAAHRPEALFSQVQSADLGREFARALRAAVGPACTMVNWSGDVRTGPSQPVERWMAELASVYDLMLFDNTTYPEKLKAAERAAAACGYLSCGIDLGANPWDPGAAETRGAVFLGTNYKNLDGGARERLAARLGREPGLDLEIRGRGWDRPPAGVRSGPFVPQLEAARIMRAARVTISTSLFDNLGRYTSDRLKRAMCAGAVVAARRFPDAAGLGLAHGENCLIWDTPDELVGLIRDWSRPERASDRNSIRKAAAELARERFSWERAVEELLAILRDVRARRRAR